MMKLYIFMLLLMQVVLILGQCESSYYSQKFQFQPPDKCSEYTTDSYQTTTVNLLAPKWGYEEIIVTKCYLEATYRQKSTSWVPRYSTNVIKAKQILPVADNICNEIAVTKTFEGQQMQEVEGQNLFYIVLSSKNELSSLNSTTRLILTEVIGYTDGRTIQVPHFPENIIYKAGLFVYNNVTSIWNNSKICHMENIGTFDIMYTSTLIIVPQTMIVFQRTNETSVGCSDNQRVELLKNGFGIIWDETIESNFFKENKTLNRRKRSIAKYVTSAEFTDSMIHNFLKENNGNRKKRSALSETLGNSSFNALYDNICIYHDQKVDKFLELSSTNITEALKIYLNNIFSIEQNSSNRAVVYSICLPRPEIFAAQSTDLLKQNAEHENEALSKYIEKLNPFYKLLNSVAGPEILTLTSVRNSDASEKIAHRVNETVKILDDIYNNKVLDLLTSIYGLLTEPTAFICRIGNCIWDAIVSFFWTWILPIVLWLTVIGVLSCAGAYYCTRCMGKQEEPRVFAVTNQRSRKTTKGEDDDKRKSYVMVPIGDDVFQNLSY